MMQVPSVHRSAALRRAASAAGLGLALCWAVPAHADLFADNDARRAILDLRTQLAQTQQTQQDENAKQAKQMEQMRGSMLDLSNQIDQLKGEMAQLRGQQDTTTRQLNDTIAKVAAGQKDLSARLAPLEPMQVQIGGKTVTVQPAEKAAFDQAMTVFRSSDFAGAAVQFKAFGDQYPSSPYMGEARYWLANSYFGAQNYKEAVAAFQGLITAQPDGDRVPEALLGLANSQAQLKDVHGARLTLKKLIKNYPKSEAAQAARDRLSKL